MNSASLHRFGREDRPRMLRSVPTRYRGTVFASTLEADWAATLDHWGMAWQYEPEAFQLPNGINYRPDFHLPNQRVWLEVKGPHDRRLGKAAELQRALYEEAGGEGWSFHAFLVIVLRPAGADGKAHWEGSVPGQSPVVMRCSACDHHVWMDHNGIWSCRLHFDKRRTPHKPWLPHGDLFWPGELPFIRAPRPSRREGA